MFQFLQEEVNNIKQDNEGMICIVIFPISLMVTNSYYEDYASRSASLVQEAQQMNAV